MANSFQTATAALLLAFGIGMISAAQAPGPVPPDQLVQYIREARRRGVNEARIKQQAIAVGWSASVVDAALAIDKGGAAPEAAKPAPGLSTRPSPPPIPDPSPAAQSAAGSAGTNRSSADDYRIGAGDTLQVSVFKEAEVSVPVAPVRPDGRITIPLIKEVMVAGLTPREAEQVIADGLKKYIEDANVTVVVTTFNSKKVYVVGAVRKESPIPYTYGMTVLQALSEAGGLTDFAKRKKIYILRSESGREYRLDFNYDEVVKGERMEQNIVLLPNDTIMIPR